MSENENNSNPEVKLASDWSRDHFPTSAKPIFLGWAAMVFGVIVLCAVAYYTSEHQVDTSKIQKQETARARIHELSVSEDE